MTRYPRTIALAILLLSALMLGARQVTARYEAVAIPHPMAEQRPEAAIGSAITYQGQLKRNGASVFDTCSFTFSLWDAAGTGSPPSGGQQIGGQQTLNGVTVANGLFTVTLNGNGEFGADAFNGEGRWLQTAVQCPADGGATTLSPRQPITPAPYALAAPGSAYRNVVIVAKTGGDYTSVQAALDNIVDASAGNPYLVWIAPGVYTETVTLKSYVDVEGAGQLATKITFGGSGSNTTGTVVTASDMELRSLTVENTGNAAYAIAILNSGTSPRLTDLTAIASGDNNISAAVFSNAAASPSIRDASLMTSGAGFNHYTLYSVGSSTPSVSNSAITAIGGATTNYGVVSVVNSLTTITGSTIRGTSAAVHMLNSPGRIAASLLEGGATTGGTGTVKCVGAYDETFTALDASC